MAYQNREGAGALFKTRNRQGNQPHYRGDCRIEGKDYAISAWIKSTRDGSTYLSMQIQPAEEAEKYRRAKEETAEPGQAPPSLPQDEDIPF